MYDGGIASPTRKMVWVVEHGLAASCGRMCDLPYNVKKDLVAEFELLKGRNERPPQTMPEWYLFFGDMYRIASNKDVLGQLMERVDQYSLMYPLERDPRKSDAIIISERPPLPSELKKLALEEAAKEKQRARRKRHYDNKCAKMSEEDKVALREKWKEESRIRRANMTPEQLERTAIKREERRKRMEAAKPEVREARIQKMRLRYASMTDEERRVDEEKRQRRHQERMANISPEDKAEYLARRRQRRKMKELGMV